MAVIDPGVDAYTGTAMFLEGHRQNSAVFSPRYASAHVGPFADLSPAFAYQVLVPLLLIVLGFGAMPREREGKTDYLLLSSSVSGSDLWLGKTLALAGAMAATLIPLALALLLAISSGESAVVAIYFLLGYLAYLLVWVLVISAVSAWMRNASASFSIASSGLGCFLCDRPSLCCQHCSGDLSDGWQNCERFCGARSGPQLR